MAAPPPPQQQQQQAAAPATAAAPPPPAAAEDKWVVNKPVERRSQALNEELEDCLGRFWTWVTCGGPAARIRQLYVHGRLSRCWDEYTRFRNCLVIKLNPDAQISVLPGPHPLWHIRTRKQAAEFWAGQYAHLGAGAAGSGSGSGGGSGGGQQQQAPPAEGDERLRPDLTSNPRAA